MLRTKFFYIFFLIILLPFLSFLNANFQALNDYQFFAPLRVGIIISFFILLLSLIIALMSKIRFTSNVTVFFSIFLYILFSYNFWDINNYLYSFIIIIVPIILSYILSRSENFRNIFSTTVIVIFLVSSIQAVINFKSSRSLIETQLKLKLISSKIAYKTPNVYFFMLDGYSRSDELAKLNIDNKYFLNHLIDNDFFVAKQSTSNGMSTVPSLQALYQMEYPDFSTNKLSHINKIIEGYNSVIYNFKSLGYQHIRMGPNQAKNTDCSGKEDICLFKLNEIDGNSRTAGYIYTKIIEMTPLSGFINFLQNIYIKKLFPRNVYDKSTIKDAHLAWEKIQKQITSPYFLEMNVWQPHAPRLFNKECDPISNILDYQDENYKKGHPDYQKAIRQYEGEIHCVNKQIMNFINFINKTDPEAIIVILSDHGHLFLTDMGLKPESWSNESIKARSSNLLAVKIPEYCRNLLYSQISPVNVFRIVFSCIYKEEISLLPDRVYRDGILMIK